MTTTPYAPQTAPGRWISAAELARESGLREDLVQRFMPADTTGPAPMYSAGAVPLAKYVKRLTDMGTPASAIDTAVRELHNNTGAMMQISLTAPVAPSRRGRILAISGAAAAAALIVGGVIGGLIGSDTRDTAAAPAPAPVTVTAEAPPEKINVNIPSTADPACQEWAPIVDSYNGKQSAWTKTDPNLAAQQWSPEQRALSLSMIPVMQAEAADMRMLASKARDPYLASLMSGQAVYEDEYASRLANYQPSDHRFWDAVISFSGAVKAVCTATR
ncbi:hypothetical protein E3G68_005028 [Mycobacteroides abscessus]|uniref:hypothetical protein n=1 Tax=Mycobacteroides abscessus TaxID=36809 RepID=UPI00187887CD|nr:hypothetical protein [Mycobacteroides abscessus]